MKTITNPRPCKCKAYAFPHRPTGGACESIAQEIHEEKLDRQFLTPEQRKADEVGVPAYGPL